MKKLFLLYFLFCITFQAFSQWSLDLEGNYIFSIPYNDVRIPSQGGTEIDIAYDLQANTTFTYRVRVNYTINERHVISGLLAPLTIKSAGTLKRDIFYSGKNYRANVPLNTTYKFYSYRLTYRYLFVNKDHIQFGMGITGKIREANITFANTDTSSDYPDLGLVPLINFYLQWSPTDQWSLLLEGDALGTRQGRVEDIFLGTTFRLSPVINLKAGHRLLEGGADVTDNYNFSFINYAAVGVVISL